MEKNKCFCRLQKMILKSEEFESNYRGSESEKNDLIDLYKKYKGDMNRYIMT